MVIVKDRTQETTTVTGTGAATLLGAATGFRTFASQYTNGQQTAILIRHRNRIEWEVSRPIYSANTLDRSNIVSSSNNDTAVNFSAGVKDVFCTLDSATIQTLINGGGGINTEFATDNNDGTYTFANTPVMIFIETGVALEGVNYSMSGLTLTALSPSGSGLIVRSIY